MVTERLEVRLDPERRRKLDRLARERNAPLSEVVRQLIDQAYMEADHARRLRAAEIINSANTGDMPDPETLNKLLEDAHDPRLP